MIKNDIMFEKNWIKMAITEFAKTSIKNDEFWRASYTKEDKAGVELLQTWMKDLELNTYFDGIGNLFGRIEGKSAGEIMVGSHRDTVKNGGALDGALGVLTAILALASLHREYGTPQKTVEVAAFCEEEGSRFLAGYIGSRNIIGQVDKELLADVDYNGISLGDAVKSAGYSGKMLTSKRERLERFVELHIEQGGLLEAGNKDIGIVSSIVGIYVGTIKFFGKQNHAGTTPMSLRVDPVPYMAELIVEMNKWAKDQEDKMVCTFGTIDVSPGTSNVIPAEAAIMFDIRSGDKEMLSAAERKLDELIEAAREKITVELDVACNEPPTKMDSEGVRLIEEVAKELGLSSIKMDSGAGHDAQIIGEHFNTNLIFVPSIDGISHSPKEDTDIEDIYNGYLTLKTFLRKIAW